MTDTVPTKQNNKLHLGGQRRKTTARLFAACFAFSGKDAKIKQLKNHTGRGAHKNARWTIK
jgi:hypothetical protein